MIEVTTTQFAKNPSHYQALAQKEPVIVRNGKGLEVLLDYNKKPFVSLYDALVTNMPVDLREALAQIDDSEDEPDDFSYINHSSDKQVL